MFKTYKTNILLIFTSILVALYLCEAFLTINQNKKTLAYKIKIYKKKTGLDYDLRSMIEIYNDEKKIDNNVTIRYSPKVLLKHNIKLSNDLYPLSGISNSKTIHCNEEGYYSKFYSDRYGFNNPDKVWKNSNVNAIFIGGSFTFGDCVNRPNDIPSVIRDKTASNIINLGYRGNGPLVKYATLREYFVKGTKNIVWIYYENALDVLKKEKESQILNKYLLDRNFSQNLIFRQNEIDKANKELIDYLYNINLEVDSLKQHKKDMNKKNRILKFIRFDSIKTLVKNYSNKKINIEKELPFDYFQEILSEVKNFADMNNSNLYFVYMPSVINFNNKNFENNNFLKIKDIITNLNIEFVDLKDDLFNDFKDPLKYYTFRIGPHLNIQGYKEAALKIIESANLK
ncbi:hypothetical protein N9U27_01990 [Candidatus Pelagibacter sp.]|nr:hypothetical protein [Candidatus Pelagibacter sp.]